MATKRGMTDEEVKALALRMYRREVFTSLQIAQAHVEQIMPIIFVPLAFMDAKSRRALAAKKIGMFYAPMAHASPRSVNGYPIFLEFTTVSQTDTKRVLAKLEEIKSTMEKL